MIPHPDCHCCAEQQGCSNNNNNNRFQDLGKSNDTVVEEDEFPSKNVVVEGDGYSDCNNNNDDNSDDNNTFNNTNALNNNERETEKFSANSKRRRRRGRIRKRKEEDLDCSSFHRLAEDSRCGRPPSLVHERPRRPLHRAGLVAAWTRWLLLLISVLNGATSATPPNGFLFDSTENAADQQQQQRQLVRIKYPPFVRINRCFSCMSPMYEPFFRGGSAESSHLAKYFYEPRNFTVQCDEPMVPDEVGVVPCRGICLTLTQEFIVMGRRTGKRLTMRGCATSLSRYGFYNRTFALFDQYDLCREVQANELFRYDTDSQPIRVCSCLGDRCNSATNPLPPSSLALLLILSVAVATSRVHAFNSPLYSAHARAFCHNAPTFEVLIL